MLHITFRFLRTSSVAVATAFLLTASTVQAQVDLPPPGPTLAEAPGADEPGIETLTQGPIHEAFANPADMDPTPGAVVAKQPPPDVTEDPPEFMPEGAIWIPGYWVWDDDRDEFLWVTGVARVSPPGMRWVPGYFAEAEGGWQRVSGFWVSTETPEVEYRPTAPPATLETGPSSPAPADDHFWIPGSWNYYDTGYRWQAGYWAPYQPNWIWVPARWVWTPGGFVYCPGFWDHRLAFRGQMFAPVYFQQPLYTQPGWTYRPWCVIPTNNLFIHLWIRPRWGCYYYGNYYDPRFANRGFVAWANIGVGRQRGFYDPFHSYAHVHYRRQGVDYLGRVQGWHNHYAKHEDLRPQRTWHEQQQKLGRGGKPALETQLVARHVAEVARRDDTAVRMTRLDEQAQRNQRQQVERLREFHTERSHIEHTARQAAARLPDRPGEARDTGKAGGSLVDRVEGKTGRDSRDTADRPGRDTPKLTIPKDLPGSGRSVVRTQPAEGDRGGRDQTAPPPRPRPTSRVGTDDARPGAGDRQPKGTAKTADRDETPRGGKVGDQPRLPGRDSQPGTGRNVAGDDRGPKTGRGDDANRTETGKTRTSPQVERPGRTVETPSADRPGARSDVPRTTPRTETGRDRSERPSPGPRPDAGGKGSTSEVPRSSPVIPRGNTPSVRPETPRANPPENRGKAEAPRGVPRADATPGRIESQRPTFRAETPAPMPRVEPRAESRPMPRVEAPRESRPMPRVETPRENRPAPRVETPRPTPRTETSRPSPSPDRGSNPSRAPQVDRPDAGNPATTSNAKGNGGNKRRGRDND